MLRERLGDKQVLDAALNLCTPISLQVSRSVSCSGVLRHGITAAPMGPGAGRKRLRASTCWRRTAWSAPTTTSVRPLSRQNTACWEKELCLMNLRALRAAFLLLFLCQQLLLLWMLLGEGGAEEPVMLVLSDASSMLGSLRGGQGGLQAGSSWVAVAWQTSGTGCIH